MKAQEIRDKLAAVRSLEVRIDGKKVEAVVIDLANSIAHILSETGAPPPSKLTILEERLLESALSTSVQDINKRGEPKKTAIKDIEWRK